MIRRLITAMSICVIVASAAAAASCEPTNKQGDWRPTGVAQTLYYVDLKDGTTCYKDFGQGGLSCVKR